MTINERVKHLRKELGLNQTDFGKRIAIAQGYLTNIENGKRDVTEKTIKLICLRFNVNEEWLRTGKGEMFVEDDNTILSDLVREYGLDGVDAKILDTYIHLPEDSRNAVKNFLCALAEAVQEGTTNLEDFIESDRDAVSIFRAARSDDNAEPQMLEVPKSRIDKLKEAKPAKEI